VSNRILHRNLTASPNRRSGYLFNGRCYNQYLRAWTQGSWADPVDNVPRAGSQSTCRRVAMIKTSDVWKPSVSG
jgi:hypothetical protein